MFFARRAMRRGLPLETASTSRLARAARNRNVLRRMAASVTAPPGGQAKNRAGALGRVCRRRWKAMSCSASLPAGADSGPLSRVGRWAADGQRAFSVRSACDLRSMPSFGLGLPSRPSVRSACASFLGSSHEDPRATTLEPVGNLTAALCRLDIPKAADLSGFSAGGQRVHPTALLPPPRGID